MIRMKNVLVGFGLVLAATACTTTGQKKADPTPAPSPAATTAPSTASKSDTAGTRLEIECKNGEDKRRLTVAPSDKGCELHYEKFGKSSVAASSGQDSGHCDRVQAKMKKNLEGAGFTCN